MGKREFLIGLGFAIAGLLVYALTSTPAGDRRSAPGLESLVDRWRDDAGTSARGTVETTGTIAIGTEIQELDLATFTNVTVRGEKRSDAAWTLRVEASGADEETANRIASSVRLAQDDRGATLALSASTPDGARRLTTALTLAVPARMHVTISDARGGRVEGVGAVALEGLSGDFDAREIAGAITGAHRNGALRVEGAGDVRLSLVGTQAVFREIRGEAAVTCRNGECIFEASHAPLVIESTNSTIAVKRAAADVRLSATGGRVSVDGSTASVHIETRRAAVTLTLTAAVPATVVSSDGKVVLELAAPLPITLDAIAARGSIDATSVGLEPHVELGTATLRHAFGTTSRVSLRNDRDEIVIVRRY